MSEKSPIECACDIVGGQVQLANALGVSPQAVNQWVARGKVPVERVRDVVRATEGRITAHELASLIYPEGFEFPAERVA